MRVSIYTDGSARGNPDGPGGYGCILQYVDSQGRLHEKEISQGYMKTTNNRMELMAAIAALRALKVPCDVTLTSDSRYLVDGIEKGWAVGWRARGWKKADKSPALNPDLWGELLELFERHTVRLVWVRGHVGHPYNERCDALATTFADSFPDKN
jgi:ribonuclease HI